MTTTADPRDARDAAGLTGRAARIARHSPYTQRGLPRWLARNGGIDAAIASGALPDPLYGNYRVLPLSHVVITSPAAQRKYQVTSLATKLLADQVGVYPVAGTASREPGSPADDRRLALACADFDGDGRDEIVWLADVGGVLRLVVARGSDGIAVASDTPLPYTTSGEAALACGVFYEPTDPDGANSALRPQIVVGWVDGSAWVHLELFTVDKTLTPHHVSGVPAERLAALGSRYSLAAGDALGDGLDVIALGTPAPNGTGVRLYGVSESGAFKPGARTTLGRPAGEGGIALAFGDFDHDAVQELAAVWEEDRRVRVQLLSADQDLALKPRGKWVDDDPGTELTGAARLAVTSGALALVGPAEEAPGAAVDQIVIGYQVGEHEVALKLFQSDQQLSLGPKYLKARTRLGAGIGWALTGFDLVLRCGSLVGGALNTVVVGSVGSSYNTLRVLAGYRTVTVGLVPVAPDLSRFGAFVAKNAYSDEQAQDKSGRCRLGLALGDLTGASVRVGPPKRLRAEQVNQVLAVLNAPPAHEVRVDGEDPDNLNFDGEAWLDFTNSQGKETEFRSELHKDWGYSEELRGGIRTPIFYVDASLSKNYGEHFSKVSQQTVSTKVTLDKDQLWTEDAVVMVTTAYTAWEYDVYDTLSDKPSGKMAVIFPDTRPPRLSIKGSKDPLFGYYPTHAVGDALSYPTVDDLPDDVSDGRTLASVELTVGASQSKLTLDWESTKEQMEVRSTEQGVAFGVDAGFVPAFKGLQLGIQVGVDGRYSENEMTSIATKMTESTQVTIAYYPLAQPKWRYSVEPIVYWSKRWGFLVVDYLVDIPESDTFPTAWQKVYSGKCDLGFSLPWYDGSHGAEYKLLTRDIYLQKAADGALEAEVTVRNMSLAPARAVRVDLYDDDVSKDKPVHTETVPLVAARGTATFTYAWAAGPGGHTVRAVVDPDGVQPDLYRKNNVGWSRIVS